MHGGRGGRERRSLAGRETRQGGGRCSSQASVFSACPAGTGCWTPESRKEGPRGSCAGGVAGFLPQVSRAQNGAWRRKPHSKCPCSSAALAPTACDSASSSLSGEEPEGGVSLSSPLGTAPCEHAQLHCLCPGPGPSSVGRDGVEVNFLGESCSPQRSAPQPQHTQEGGSGREVAASV